MAVVLITGATRGIGEAAALELAARGAELAITGRDPARVRATAARLRSAGGGPVHEYVADLELMSGVRALAAAVRGRHERIDVLANNAGALFNRRGETAEGLERTFALNHMAPFLLTLLLRDRLAGGRVVTTSSGAHRAGLLDLGDLQSQRGYRAFRVYGTTKLCNILFTRELARRAPELRATCFHPGVVRTGFGKGAFGAPWIATTLTGPFLRSPARGARSLVWLAGASETAELTGVYVEDERVVPPSAQAQDDVLAAGLWEAGVALAGDLMALPFPALARPIVLAPMAGGPSTPALTAAVSAAGGLGFVAAGYRTPDELAAEIAAVRGATAAPFGVNLFLVGSAAVDEGAIAAFAARIAPEAERHGVALGEPRFDDDGLEGKLEVVSRERPAIVSFTFGCPPAAVVERLHERGIAVWVTVTDPAEAAAAQAAGADALVVQGVEAGGHRGSFADENGRGEMALLPLLALAGAASDLPLVASGGIAGGAGVAAVLAAGARAAQIGTAFMRCPEAGTGAAQREALARPGTTALTRAFTGRRARGIVNAFMLDHEPAAPSAYPHVHHLTAPLRRAARAAGDAGAINLWAGEAHALAEDAPAAELVARWSAEARAALEAASRRLPGA